MSDIHEQLLDAFQVEHKEHVEGIRAQLAALETGGEATEVDLEEAFRRAHSLKAAARVCDLRPLDALCDRLEMLFGRLRQHSVPLDKAALACIHLVLDAIENWTATVAQKRSPPDLSGAMEALEKFLDLKAASPARPTRPSEPAETDTLSRELLAAFQIEHKEHLEGIRSILGDLEKGEPGSKGQIDEAFRRAHSLKGAARLAGLRQAETVAHRLETLFSRVRENSLQLDRDVMRAIYQGLDAIEDGAVALLQNRSAPVPTAALAAIEKALGTSPETTPAPVERPGAPESRPEPGPALPAVETVRVSADNLDRLLRSTGQLLTESQRQNLVARELTCLSRQIDSLEKEWESVRNVAGTSLRQLASMPELARAANYMDLVEHGVRSLSRRARSVSSLQQRSAWTLRLLGGQLQQDVRRVRMVAAETVFQGFRKMVRDLARDEGKEIEFRVSGFEIQADRLVLQALKDPLMHILCNAVSHGIEAPEDRQRQGKSMVGQVRLHLDAPANRLQIRVEDDGRGIDHQKVADVAIRRGFLSETEAAESSPEDLARLIFKPGFSTSRAVTGLSGRGMGLSVVYEAVTRLQGEVNLRPLPEGGIAIDLSVPLSIATQRLLLVGCRAQTFAIPIHGIEQVLRVKIQDVETVEGKPMILLQGQPITLLSLAYLLSIGETEEAITGDSFPVMILRSGTRRVAVAVDAFLEERDGLIKELDDPAAQITKMAGGILLEDGSVCLVLNLAELVKTVRPSERVPSFKRVEAAPEKKRAIATVLVVDDSLTTRTLEKSLLEAHGYQVRIAMDGIEALNQLHVETADLVITDVQMPRMDGFTLLEEMKKDERLAQIPVIVVSSMDRREDQERGLALGADAYIVKRKFDHQDLLETIRQII